MLKFKIYIIPFLAILFWSCEHVHKSISEGNAAYFDGHFSEAIRHYNKALELDSSSYVASFNKGNALYKKQVGVDTLKQHWEGLLQRANSEKDIANIYHNLGNSLLANGKIKEAIEAYKSALRLKPYYEDTRYNLAYAQKLLPPEQQNKDQNKNQDQKNQDQKDNKENQDQKNKDSEDQNKDQNKGEGDNKSKDQENKKGEDEQKDGSKGQNEKQNQSGQKQQPQKGQLTKEQAKRLLDHIRRQEDGIRAKVNKGKEKNVSTENKNKNW